MIVPSLKNKDLLDNIRSAEKGESGLHFWWLGQSGFLLQWDNRHLLIDPYLSDSLTKKYEKTDKPHVRMTELVINPESLDFIDAVTSSHNHTDHLDGETLVPIIEANPHIEIVLPRANLSFAAQRLGQGEERFRGLNDGESITLNCGITVHGIPAAHNELERDDLGNCRFMGYVFEMGKFVIYHSGDTLWRDEIIQALQPFDIDIALLPINGNVPARRVAGNLNARQAVDLANLLNVKLVIPCHYHMFTFNTVDPDEFIRLASDQGISFRVLQGGERFTYA